LLEASQPAQLTDRKLENKMGTQYTSTQTQSVRQIGKDTVRQPARRGDIQPNRQTGSKTTSLPQDNLIDRETDN
jgi:hypothetical protein